MTSEWVWSHDGERFNGGPEDSREAAIEEAKAEGATQIGRKVDYDLFNWDVVDHLIEQEHCEACEEVGEVADSWPHVDARADEYKVAREKIVAIMRELVGKSSFYTVEDIEEIGDESQ